MYGDLNELKCSISGTPESSQSLKISTVYNAHFHFLVFQNVNFIFSNP